MSQGLLTPEDVQDNINNNNVVDFVSKSRSDRQHDGQSRATIFDNTRLLRMGVTNFDSSKSSVWRNVPLSPQVMPPSAQHDNNNGRGRVAKIEEGLDNSVGSHAKSRINKILEEVNNLSDVEKLLLYLKLPTGALSNDDSPKQLPTLSPHTANRAQQGQAFTWIKTHLEVDQEICLPKQEVFDDYRAYCENHSLKYLSTADFGKVMKCVFPNIKPRRLGQRGQSKYCYSGLRKKTEVQPPSLPELEIGSAVTKDDTSSADELFTASCHLVCEWAHKLLGRSFSDLRELAEFLLTNLYVNSKSVSAFSVLAAMPEAPKQLSKGNISQLFTNSSGGNKHRETQLQLQRKLQERELLKEQKRKLQQQRSENEQEQSRAGSSSERELSTPSLLHGRSTERELETPSLSVGRSSATPVEEMPSPCRSSVSCSPVCTPTRADSVESRRTTSETEFVSPVAMRATYRRRNSHGSAEKERRKRINTSSQLTSPFYEAARSLLEGSQNLDRQLFASSDEEITADVIKHSERDPITPRQSSFERRGSVGQKYVQEQMETESVKAATVKDLSDVNRNDELKTASVAAGEPCAVNSTDNNNMKQVEVTRLPQPAQVPIIPSRSAFVPFPQRVIGSVCQVSAGQSLTPSTTVMSQSHSQKSRGLARLLMSKPRKEVAVIETISKSQIVQSQSANLAPSGPSTSASKDSLISIRPAIQSSPLEVNNNHRSEQAVTPSSSPSAENNGSVTSPLTPRRTKTRFTPIRPKAPAPRTVSSMLREQRGSFIAVEGTSFGSKPVSEILKEKRERETLLLPASPSSGSASGMQVSPKIAIPTQIPVLPTVLSQTGEVTGSLTPGGKPSEVFLIMGSPPSSAQSSPVVPVKAKRSNTISIPIVPKDIVAKLKHGSQYKDSRSKHSHTQNLSSRQSYEPALLTGYQAGGDGESKMETEDNPAAVENSSTSKRKRKSPGSAKEPFVVGADSYNGFVKPLNVDDNIALTDTDESSGDVSDENNPKRSKSCVPPLEKHNSFGIVVPDERVCPDITSLESDALVDMPLSAAELASSLGPETTSMEQVHNQASVKTASVGVTKQSMALSHKLLKQSRQLDKRINTFLKQRSLRPKTSPTEPYQWDSQALPATPGKPTDDMSVMTSQYCTKTSSNRTASDTKLSVKPNSSQEKARSTVHRGVVQTSNSFVVKKPLASKGSTKDHFLLKLLTSDSSPVMNSPKKKEVGVLPCTDLQSRTRLVESTAYELKQPVPNSDLNFLEGLDSVFSRQNDTAPQDMDTSVESELPTDVADFITEAMEKRSSSGYITNQASAFVLTDFSHPDIGLSNLTDSFPSSFQQHSTHSKNLSSDILSSQIPGHPPQDSLFTVPSIPPSAREVRQKRSFSVPASSAQPASSTNTVLENTSKIAEHGESGLHSHGVRPLLLRLNSIDRLDSQTPISDAGYHSFDSSPVPNSTPLPIHSMQQPNVDLSFTQVPTDGQRIVPQIEPHSPMLSSSPKEQSLSARSTPVSHMSTSVVSRSSASSSPIEPVSAHSRFMPIGGSGVLQIDKSLMNPIKPIVTLASSSAFTTQIVSPKAVTTSPSIQPGKGITDWKPDHVQSSSLKSPPSYQDAIQSLQHQTPTLAVTRDTKVHPPPPDSTNVSGSEFLRDVHGEKQQETANTALGQILSDRDLLKSSLSPAVYPFSYHLSLLRSKSDDSVDVGEDDSTDVKVPESNLSSPMSGSTCSDYSALGFQSSAESDPVEFQNVATLIKHYHANSRQQVETRKQPPLLSVLPEDIWLRIQEQKQKAAAAGNTESSSQTKQHFDLPDARYVGSTPNVDVRHLLSEKDDIPQPKVKPNSQEESMQIVTMTENSAIDIRSLLQVKFVCTDSSPGEKNIPRVSHTRLNEGAYMARRNLSQILAGSSLGGPSLGEDDLQTTLEDLKSLDTQYFNNIPMNDNGSEQAIPEDIRDLNPLDMASSEPITFVVTEDTTED